MSWDYEVVSSCKGVEKGINLQIFLLWVALEDRLDNHVSELLELRHRLGALHRDTRNPLLLLLGLTRAARAQNSRLSVGTTLR